MPDGSPPAAPPESAPESAPEPLLSAPSYLVYELVRLIRRKAGTTRTADNGGLLRMPHLMALACVAAYGPLSQREVSDRLWTDAGDLVAVVDALERDGLVERRRDPGDRRRYRLEVTGPGRRALAAQRDRRARLNEELFAPLAEQERADLEDMLLRVLAHHDPRFAPGGARPPIA
ncbi:MarR family winged helix-turn-helix transcriptional regulator [Actinomadura parmotrematis]|uniref:MarR family winged helix-turn-helix transcriptional regulator n=1 Tax=Actinomadura parmotrematis TaxID=2864039 RepID=A0ABS7FTA7_9ACTN|nr:MarR family winged helix-turn-helix transcriptional regulator [Actinomadura parmotrematis]MBW8482783.1 MarR family winged helix-turn-helix transcriptional regulator [Actinomadura parmotrematis]